MPLATKSLEIILICWVCNRNLDGSFVLRMSTARIPRRDREAYARARRWRWGDAVL